LTTPEPTPQGQTFHNPTTVLLGEGLFPVPPKPNAEAQKILDAALRQNGITDAILLSTGVQGGIPVYNFVTPAGRSFGDVLLGDDKIPIVRGFTRHFPWIQAQQAPGTRVIGLRFQW
jgi:hypothetical protein